jgi:hypothetical protein
VIAEAPYDIPLEYYFEKYSVPTGFLFSYPQTADELFVVVPIGEMPEDALKGIGELADVSFGSLELIARLMDTAVFEIVRLKR